jgi:hypothetical protein
MIFLYTVVLCSIRMVTCHTPKNLRKFSQVTASQGFWAKGPLEVTWNLPKFESKKGVKTKNNNNSEVTHVPGCHTKGPVRKCCRIERNTTVLCSFLGRSMHQPALGTRAGISFSFFAPQWVTEEKNCSSLRYNRRGPFFSVLASFHENSCPELNSQPFLLKIGSFDLHWKSTANGIPVFLILLRNRISSGKTWFWIGHL